MPLTLKHWEAVTTERGVGMTCPWPSCGGKVIVNMDKLREVKAEAGIVTAPCPYCAHVSYLPEED